jgi:hypothetical protein
MRRIHYIVWLSLASRRLYNILYFLWLYSEFFIILYNILKIDELDCCQIIILSIYVPYSDLQSTQQFPLLIFWIKQFISAFILNVCWSKILSIYFLQPLRLLKLIYIIKSKGIYHPENLMSNESWSHDGAAQTK